MNEDMLEIAVNLFMCSDPWPLSEDDRFKWETMLDDSAIAHGYKDWLDFYHRNQRRG